MPTQQWIRDNPEKVRAARRRWYANNRAHAKAKVSERKAEMKAWLVGLKSTLKCPCGMNHVAALTFHHNDPEEKDIEIAKVISNGWSKERILKEMQKCSVLCRNCHAILHWEEHQNRVLV